MEVDSNHMQAHTTTYIHMQEIWKSWNLYQNFKAKHITKLSLSNIPKNDRSMVSPSPQSIMDELMLEPKTLPSNQGRYVVVPPPISYKRPRDNKMILFVPLKIKISV